MKRPNRPKQAPQPPQAGKEAPLVVLSGSRCKACKSANRGEIDRRLVGGESTRAVSSWLLETHGEAIDHKSLVRHKQAHANAPELAREIIAKRATPPAAKPESAPRPVPSAAVEEAAERIVADADVLAEVTDLCMSVVRAQAPKMSGRRKKTYVDVMLFTGAAKEAREASVARYEMLHGKKVNVENASGGLASIFAELERREGAESQ